VYVPFELLGYSSQVAGRKYTAKDDENTSSS